MLPELEYGHRDLGGERLREGEREKEREREERERERERETLEKIDEESRKRKQGFD